MTGMRGDVLGHIVYVYLVRKGLFTYIIAPPENERNYAVQTPPCSRRKSVGFRTSMRFRLGTELVGEQIDVRYYWWLDIKPQWYYLQTTWMP